MAEPSRKKIKTRSSGDYFLSGRSTPHISGNKLPLLKLVLQHVLHLKESSSSTTPLKNHFSAVLYSQQRITIFYCCLLLDAQTRKRNYTRHCETTYKIRLLRHNEVKHKTGRIAKGNVLAAYTTPPQ